MIEGKEKRKVIKALPKGQITIPREFREALNIDVDTLLDVTIVGDHLEIFPIRDQLDSLRHYTREEVTRFLEEDKIDKTTAEKIRRLLKQG